VFLTQLFESIQKEVVMKKTEASVAKNGSAGDATDWNNHFTAQWSEMLERSGQAYAKILTAWRDEMVGFTEKRLQADLELMRDIHGCQNWTEMMDLQQGWVKNTIEHYVDENSRLMDLCREAAEVEIVKVTPEPKVVAKSESKTESRPETKHADIKQAETKHEIRRAA
jgi:hypothetical protein